MNSFSLPSLTFVSIVCIFISCGSDPYESGFSERANMLTSVIADTYSPPSIKISDPEKYYWPKVMARFERYGVEDSISNAWINTLKDHSPFHFTLVGMARLMYLYPDAPAVKANHQTILKKVFERTDSHNAWTGEGTENHTNMARCSGFLYAQAALEYPDDFQEAQGKYKMMKQWIMDCSAAIFQHGTGEFNSSIYQAYSVISWLNVYDFAQDEEVRNAARAVLDYYAAEIALHYSWGTTGGSEMRGSGAKNMNLNATNYLAWLWFGENTEALPFEFRGNQYIQCIHAITSTYRPAKAIIALARKKENSIAWYKNSKPEYLFSRESFVKQFFFIGDGYTLGSCTSAYGGWTGTTYQTVNWRLIVRPGSSSIPFEVGGNGRFYDDWSGRSTSPFTQNFQHRNTLIQLTCTPVNALELSGEIIERVNEWTELWKRDFDKRFPSEMHKGKTYQIVNYVNNIVNENKSYISLPENIEILNRGKLICIGLGDCFLGIYAIGNIGAEIPLSIKGKGKNGRKFLLTEADPGDVCGFVMEVHSRKEFSGLEGFTDEMEGRSGLNLERLDTDKKISYTNLEGDEIEMQYVSSGAFMEATVDWGYGPTKAGAMLSGLGFIQPDWPSGDGYGRLPSCRVNGEAVDFSARWPVFDGPEMTLDESILQVKSESETYRVDYSKSVPGFSIQ